MQVTASVLAAAVWSVGAAPASDPRAAHAGQREYSEHCMIRAQAAIFMCRICTVPVEIFAQICTYLHLLAPCVVHVTHCIEEIFELLCRYLHYLHMSAEIFAIVAVAL